MLRIDVKELIRRIQSAPDFDEVWEIARKNSYGPVLMVGGRVYRTITEMVHGYDCGSQKSDWDFLVLGAVKQVLVPRLGARNSSSWTPTTLPSYYTGSRGGMRNLKANSMSLKRNGSKRVRQLGRNHGRSLAPKIDLICIEDVKKGGDLTDYFDNVPLDVQRVALNLDNPQLHGPKALVAIEKRMVKFNSKGVFPNLDIAAYTKDKATSLKFGWDGQKVIKQDCNCYPGDSIMLFRMGCQFPNSHR